MQILLYYIGAPLLVMWLIHRVYFIWSNYEDYRHYKDQGVVFTGNNTFSILRDVPKLIRVLGKYPHAFN